MPDKKVFCIVPWTNTHLYWHGQYGACCYEAQPPIGDVYTLKSHSLSEWRNSETMKNFRQRIMGDKPLPECQFCYNEERHGHESRRIKENFKGAIFTEQAFDKSFDYSPWAETCATSKDVDPPDWHVDFGNECNLACKMCAPNASSRIASYYDKWNLTYKKQDNWTNDSVQWNQFLENIDKSEKLFRLHVMGGEPTISKKFLELVQKLVNANRTKLSLSFVSNGTILNTELIDLLKNFESVNIEISIESIDLNNDYIRQGSDVENVLKNISWYRNNTNFQIVLRTVPQLLSVNTYAKFIRWAFDQNLSLQSIPLFYPECLQINVLPQYLKEKYKKDILDTMSYIESKMEHTFETISTGRDISRLPNQLIRECKTIAHLLSEPDLDNIHSLRNEMINYLIRWDREFNFDARTFYPEYKEFFESHGYNL